MIVKVLYNFHRSVELVNTFFNKNTTQRAIHRNIKKENLNEHKRTF